MRETGATIAEALKTPTYTCRLLLIEGCVVMNSRTLKMLTPLVQASLLLLL